jgi:hypothetical protein
MSREKLITLQNEIHDAELALRSKQREFRSLQFDMVEAELNKDKHDSCTSCSCGTLPRRLLISSWDCLLSPINSCVYDLAQDPWHDSCLFCKEPEERT